MESGNYRTLTVDIYRDNGEQGAFEEGKVIVTILVRKDNSAMDRRHATTIRTISTRTITTAKSAKAMAFTKVGT